jgi:hypothetical protein
MSDYYCEDSDNIDEEIYDRQVAIERHSSFTKAQARAKYLARLRDMSFWVWPEKKRWVVGDVWERAMRMRNEQLESSADSTQEESVCGKERALSPLERKVREDLEDLAKEKTEFEGKPYAVVPPNGDQPYWMICDDPPPF